MAGAEADGRGGKERLEHFYLVSLCAGGSRLLLGDMWVRVFIRVRQGRWRWRCNSEKAYKKDGRATLISLPKILDVTGSVEIIRSINLRIHTLELASLIHLARLFVLTCGSVEGVSRRQALEMMTSPCAASRPLPCLNDTHHIRVGSTLVSRYFKQYRLEELPNATGLMNGGDSSAVTNNASDSRDCRARAKAAVDAIEIAQHVWACLKGYQGMRRVPAGCVNAWEQNP